MLKHCAITLVLGLTLNTTLTQADTLYQTKGLIDGTGKLLNKTDFIVSNDGQITQIGNQLKITGSQHKTVDLKHLYAMPGLIDMHTHITYGLPNGSKGNAWTELGQVDEKGRRQAALENARKTVATGVTSIRDLNDGSGLDLKLRQVFANHKEIGPRLFVSGGGVHPSRPVEPLDYAKSQIELDVDWVKIFGTTGSADDLTSKAYYDKDIVKSITDAAHKAGKRITLHSYGPEAVDAAIYARVDSIEHAVGMSIKQMIAMRDNNITYVPTIDHNRYYADHRDEYGYTEEIDKNLRTFVKKNTQAVAGAHSVGVSIATGSDAVFSGFGENTCELKQFKAAGLSNADIIQTATVNGANLLGQKSQLGRIKEGYIADIVFLEENPLDNLDTLFNGIRLVLRDGKVVHDVRNSEPFIVNCG
ncbi:amidohydrolase family protein [Alteromonadaceae bacterium M269]|nr:amidohydrolase family protein [Alteromonadaceae bacterium M269]